MKKTLVLATGAVLAASFGAGSASAVDVDLYGQVNKGVMVSDDGNATEFSVVDNDFSSTRFGLKGMQTLDNGLEASVLLEMETQNNESSSYAPATNAVSSTSTNGFATRHARVGIAGDFGMVALGTTSVATDGVMEQDLTGVKDVMKQDIEDIGGGIMFLTSAGASLTTISSVFLDMDGGRGNAVAYHTPIYNGFQGKISAANGGNIDTAVFYTGSYSDIDVKAALGYSTVENDTTAADNIDSIWSGSISAKHASGLAGTVAYAQGEAGAASSLDPKNYYVKVGYAWDAFEVAADYAKAEENAVANDELVQYGLGAQMNLGSGVSLAGYAKMFDLDRTGVNTDEVNVYGVNMRVKF